VLSEVFLQLKIHQNALAAGTLPRIPLQWENLPRLLVGCESKHRSHSPAVLSSTPSESQFPASLTNVISMLRYAYTRYLLLKCRHLWTY